MIKYIGERVVYSIITLLLIISITFLLLQFLPGSPFNDQKLPDAQKEILNEKYGLNDPIPVKYMRYMSKVIKGDFGKSFNYDNKDVLGLITLRLPKTIAVGVQALIWGVLLGIVFGAVAALKQGEITDNLVILFVILGVSIPSFVLGSLIQLFFGLKLELLPMVFDHSKYWASTILPAVSLTLYVISSVARFMRTELVEVLNSEYILLARAKGLKKSTVITRHALRNALIPVITVVGPMTVYLLTGSVVAEKIFGVPGVGLLLIEAVNMNDYFLILGIATFYSTLYISVVFIVDLLYTVIDPRVRLQGGK
ncbi:MAG: ABC transporter permease [Bacillota bacterium]